MNRAEKADTVAQLQERFQRAAVALVAIPKGLTVAQVTKLRRTIRAAGGEYKVPKNTLARRAIRETAYTKLDSLFEGPTSLVFGYSDPVAVTKALVKFVEESNAALAIKGGALEGQPMVAAQVKALATMPSIEALRARVVAMAKAPGARVVAAMKQPASRIAGAIEALVKQKQAEAGAAAPAAE
ncbi:MAG: 50S ribosomal protein L10 [Deltaproteobacteria bacterium]|nr:50S ribosomal protein L10 [Deltaproteobacteria bacterium]